MALSGDYRHTQPREDTQWVKLNNNNAAIKTGSLPAVPQRIERGIIWLQDGVYDAGVEDIIGPSP